LESKPLGNASLILLFVDHAAAAAGEHTMSMVRMPNEKSLAGRMASERFE
jgi:hypothetical protein